MTTATVPAGAPVAGPETYPRPWVATRLVYAAVTGSLVVLAFPMLGDRFHLDHLIWVAFVPLFLAARGAGVRKGFLLGWVAGMALESAGFIWIYGAIRSFSDVGPLLGSLIFLVWLLWESVAWGLLGLALGRCRRPVSVLWVLPLWVGIEHFFPRLWPWHIGGAVYARSWLVQCADIFGASGLTALVLLANSAVYLWLVRRHGSWRAPVVATAACALLVALALAYGAVRLSQLEAVERTRPRIDVGFVQGSLDPLVRRESGTERYLAWTEELLREHPGVDLVVWPEGADSRPFDFTPGFDPWAFHRDGEEPGDASAALLHRQFPVPLLVGAAGIVHGPGASEDRRVLEAYNVTAYVRPDGSLEFYRKNKPVPFGEAVPGLSLLPPDWRKAFQKTFPGIGNIELGSDNPRMALGEARFRNLLCYEAVLPGFVRRSSRGSDFLVNLTEDYWYGRTAHIPQHLSVLLLRAVEVRTPVVRVTNVGPSGIVGITGLFETRGEVFEPGRFVLSFAPGQVASVYRSWGYAFPFAALAAGLVGQALVGRAGSRRRACGKVFQRGG